MGRRWVKDCLLRVDAYSGGEGSFSGFQKAKMRCRSGLKVAAVGGLLLEIFT